MNWNRNTFASKRAARTSRRRGLGQSEKPSKWSDWGRLEYAFYWLLQRMDTPEQVGNRVRRAS